MKNLLPIDAIHIDITSKTPIYRQLYNVIRKGVIHKQFVAHTQLPSSRQLSAELNISRSTVTAAYDQLIAEGFLVSKRGSGTRVAKVLTHSLEASTKNTKELPCEEINLGEQLSTTAKTYCNTEVQQRVRTNYRQTSLMPGIPSRLNFPNKVWGRLLGKYAKKSLGLDAGYDHPAGIPQLRKAIADYICLARGVNATEQEVLIVSSTQAALDMLCRLILNKGDIAGIEEPGYQGAYLAMRNNEAVIKSIPIDSEGITIPQSTKAEITPKLIYISPTHQYPTGVTMTYARRMALLEYAQKNKVWLLEDDYDSEFRYRGKPLPSLQGLDHSLNQDKRVIYIGTFSKSLSPSMRVAYIVAPPALQAVIKAFLGSSGVGINIAVQYALAEFIEAGHYSRHIRKTRKEYKEKQHVLSTAIEEYLQDKVEFYQSNAGLQASLFFKQEKFKKPVNDQLFVKEAEKQGLYFRALSNYYYSDLSKQGLVLGFATSDIETIKYSIKKLSQLINQQ